MVVNKTKMCVINLKILLEYCFELRSYYSENLMVIQNSFCGLRKRANSISIWSRILLSIAYQSLASGHFYTNWPIRSYSEKVLAYNFAFSTSFARMS
jgi:hypothetical protein